VHPAFFDFEPACDDCDPVCPACVLAAGIDEESVPVALPAPEPLVPLPLLPVVPVLVVLPLDIPEPEVLPVD